jgi:uncharacterized membrane protein YhaH (DUF805 family)
MEDLNPIQWAILPLKKYATFSGRAPRAEYWWFYLAVVIGRIPIVLMPHGSTQTWATNIYSVALLVPTLAVMTRRFHDINRSGWWLLVFGVVFVGGAFIGAGMAAGGTTPAAFTGLVAGIIMALFGAMTIFIFTILPGTQGPNRFGLDPYGATDNLEEVFA